MTFIFEHTVADRFIVIYRGAAAADIGPDVVMMKELINLQLAVKPR